MSRMSEFNSKFGGGRDNCDAKDSIPFLHTLILFLGAASVIRPPSGFLIPTPI